MRRYPHSEPHPILSDMDRFEILEHPGHSALRRGRRSVPGQTYLITTTTLDRRPWLALWPIARAVAREIGTSRLWQRCHIHAWVLMHDHMHLLLTLGDDEPLSDVMRRAKAVSARAAHAVTASRQPFWARSFHDHALRHEEELAIAARYVIANPVRAGLVDSIWQWPFWDCDWLHEPGDGALDVPRTVGRGFRRSYHQPGEMSL